MISWPVASASQHEDPIVYKRDSTKEYIMAYFKRVGGNTKSAIGLAKTKGVDTATEIELSTLNNIIYQFCIVDKQTSLKQAKSALLDDIHEHILNRQCIYQIQNGERYEVTRAGASLRGSM
jgi:hypothetical protein